jgi:hypothetical protein
MHFLCVRTWLARSIFSNHLPQRTITSLHAFHWFTIAGTRRLHQSLLSSRRIGADEAAIACPFLFRHSLSSSVGAAFNGHARFEQGHAVTPERDPFESLPDQFDR